jgi:hypothetical protein
MGENADVSRRFILVTMLTRETRAITFTPKFDAFIAIDWSGAVGYYRGIAVAICHAGRAAPELVEPHSGRWTRLAIADWLEHQIDAGKRLLIGLDFAFGFPFEEKGGYLGGQAREVKDIFGLWSLIETKSRNETDFGCRNFVSDPAHRELFWIAGPQPEQWIERKRYTEFQCAESTQTRPDTVYKLLGSKQVGKASITGIRVLHRLRSRHGNRVAIWPFEAMRRSVIVEIYPTLFRRMATRSLAKLRSQAELNAALIKLGSRPIQTGVRHDLSDHETDALISAVGLRRIAGNPRMWASPGLTSQQVRREGWIFGVEQ